jgi:signal transduction histidine kinase
MSHELRTPLNAILGFTEMLSDGLYGEMPREFREPLADIQTNGKHLLRLINDVLDLSKIEAGKMELAVEEYSAHEVIQTVRSSLRPLAEEKGLAFSAVVDGALPEVLYGDAKRITQCLLNLAGNALKFTKRGGVTIRAAREGDLIHYSVTDTGIGIPEDQLDAVFTEFKQLNATITREFGGSGLGLSITKKFVEMHGGRIWVQSRLNEGSTFHFTIPLKTEAVATA